MGLSPGWHGGAAARALITDGSRIALYGGYGADRNRLAAGQLTDDQMRSTGEYRVVLPTDMTFPATRSSRTRP
ncbi:hypothetical protein GCM10023088_52020 [Actinomadura verrucosospora]